MQCDEKNTSEIYTLTKLPYEKVKNISSILNNVRNFRILTAVEMHNIHGLSEYEKMIIIKELNEVINILLDTLIT